MRSSGKALLVALLGAVGCSSGRDGPTPDVTAVEPAFICTAQAPSNVTLRGTDFSPAVAGALTGDPLVLMPQVFLAEAGTDVEVPAAGVSLPAGNREGTALAVQIPMSLIGPQTAGSAEIAGSVVRWATTWMPATRWNWPSRR